MKKVITVLILTLFLLASLTIGIFAESTVGDAEPLPAEENIFEAAYGVLLENSDKILSALAFASSLILALVYKRGLMPIIKNALGTLAASVTKLREETEKSSAGASDSIGLAAQKLLEAEKTISMLFEKLTDLEQKLKSAEEIKKDSERLGIIMNYQIDMLYEVFMSSSLPAYLKEEMGEKIAGMKRELACCAAEVKSDEPCKD